MKPFPSLFPIRCCKYGLQTSALWWHPVVFFSNSTVGIWCWESGQKRRRFLLGGEGYESATGTYIHSSSDGHWSGIHLTADVVCLAFDSIDGAWLDRQILTHRARRAAGLPFLINVMWYCTVLLFQSGERLCVCCDVNVCTFMKVCVRSHQLTCLHMCVTQHLSIVFQAALAVRVCSSSGSHLLCALDSVAGPDGG